MRQRLRWLTLRNLGPLCWLSSLSFPSQILLARHSVPLPGQLLVEVPPAPASLGFAVLFGLCSAMVVPPGAYWFEDGHDGAAMLLTWCGLAAVAFGGPMAISGFTGSAWAGARNAVFLGALGLALRFLMSALEVCTVLVFTCAAMTSFGWDFAGEPRVWAVLVNEPDSAAALVACGSALVALCLASSGASRCRAFVDP